MQRHKRRSRGVAVHSLENVLCGDKTHRHANARNGRGAGIVEAFDFGGDIFAAEKGRLRQSVRWANRAAAPGVVALRKVGRPEGVAHDDTRGEVVDASPAADLCDGGIGNGFHASRRVSAVGIAVAQRGVRGDRNQHE